MMERRVMEALVRDCWPDCQLGQLVGEGGTARVYQLLSRNGEELQPRQVVKVILAEKKSDSLLRRYMDRELQNMQQLAYCRYVMPLLRHAKRTLREDGQEKTAMLLVMPRCETLEEFTKQLEPEKQESFYRLLCHDIGCALKECAENKVLHRDVKPGNIFVRRERDGSITFLLGDFGVSRALDGDGDTVTRVGTPRHISPEIRDGRKLHGFNSDLFSLGTTVWDCAVGEGYWKAVSGMGTVPSPDVSANFLLLLEKLLKEDPEQRYDSAADMLQELEPLYRQALQQLGMKEKRFRDYAREAKALCLSGQWQEGLRLAAEGARAGETDAIRLHAYLLCRNYMERTDPEAVEQMHLAIRQLWPLAGGGDAAAMAILAIALHKSDAPWANACPARPDTLLQVAAEGGNAIGEYLYGRQLYYKTGGEQAKRRGMDYIGRAASRGYLPAMRIYKRILESGDCVPPQPDMVHLLELELRDYEERLSESNLRAI